MRPDINSYMMALAVAAATRATCDRLRVGCVIGREGYVLSTGYNGSLPGRPHCTDVGCAVVENHCVRTVHAEQNAVCHAAKRGISLDGATAWVTHKPCWLCARLLISAGVTHAVYLNDYGQDYPFPWERGFAISLQEAINGR